MSLLGLFPSRFMQYLRAKGTSEEPFGAIHSRKWAWQFFRKKPMFLHIVHTTSMLFIFYSQLSRVPSTSTWSYTGRRWPARLWKGLYLRPRSVQTVSPSGHDREPLDLKVKRWNQRHHGGKDLSFPALALPYSPVRCSPRRQLPCRPWLPRRQQRQEIWGSSQVTRTILAYRMPLPVPSQTSPAR